MISLRSRKASKQDLSRFHLLLHWLELNNWLVRRRHTSVRSVREVRYPHMLVVLDLMELKLRKRGLTSLFQSIKLLVTFLQWHATTCCEWHLCIRVKGSQPLVPQPTGRLLLFASALKNIKRHTDLISVFNCLLFEISFLLAY